MVIQAMSLLALIFGAMACISTSQGELAAARVETFCMLSYDTQLTDAGLGAEYMSSQSH